MNPQSDQIRALIDEIDELLHGGSNSFIWRFSGDRARHQDALERLRRYLATLQHSLRIRNLPGSESEQLPILLGGNSHNPFAIQESAPDALVSDSEEGDDATELEVRPLGYQDSDALLDQLSTELSQLREGLLAPLQQEVQDLRQQRNALQAEVTQLEISRAQKQSPDQEALLHQFIETLMGRLQERMVKQVATILQQAMPQIVASQMAALPAAEAQQVQQLQQRANTLLNNMDSTIAVFSETLEQNIQAYQQSLSVGLERMHSMGRQGEVMVSGLVNRLAEQMEHQTAAYLKAPETLYSSTPTSGASGGVSYPQSVMASPAAQSAAALRPPEPSEDLALQQAQWEANAMMPKAWQSTSSAGLLPTPESEPVSPQTLVGLSEAELQAAAQASIPAAPASDLDAFYAGFDEVATAARQALTTEMMPQAPVTDEAAIVPPSASRDGEQPPASPAPRGYASLEEALFEGIPDGELWTSPWENAPDVAATLPAEDSTAIAATLPDEAHTIHSLTDLVARTTQDLEQLHQQGEPAARTGVAVMEPAARNVARKGVANDPGVTPVTNPVTKLVPEARSDSQKKKPPASLRPYLLTQPPTTKPKPKQQGQLPTAS